MLEPEPTKRFRFIYSADPDPRTSGSKSGSNRVRKVWELDRGQSNVAMLDKPSLKKKFYAKMLKNYAIDSDEEEEEEDNDSHF